MGEPETAISQNRYVYTWSNAINNIDPDGHYPRSIKPPKTVSTDNYRPTSQPPGGYIPPKKTATNVGLSGNGQALENYYTGLGYMVGTGSYVSENNARVTAEREAGNALAAAKKTKDNLVDYIEGTIGGMIDYDYLNSMSLQDQLRYLNELKKLCDLYNQEKLSAAQALIKAKGFVPTITYTNQTRLEILISQLNSGIVPTFNSLDEMLAFQHSTAALAYYAMNYNLVMKGQCGKSGWEIDWASVGAQVKQIGGAILVGVMVGAGIFFSPQTGGGSLGLSLAAASLVIIVTTPPTPVYASDGTIMCSDTNNSSSNGMDLKSPDSFEGKSFNEVEDFLDEELVNNQGWEKTPLNDGNGVKYLNGKGGSYQLNFGYGQNTWGDGAHAGPYLKISGYGPIVRIQLIP
ncbi:hypothetical protein [Culicoidibacter larvae]|uniref:Uncharacterized protein n=1 Tax=Culicoidibacter larvae TaxID=2579976 RepID=A0A5R8QFB0_9FIRM|nr:hypothetical protein [Culicoidibacter larvae]TLG76695.1 hypothetical protein FEZ08_03515 [Culicoidibacter larvae]